ncbi:DUF1707 domain-containing protein [Micromonospora echinospora]|uniref:DUF1707 SHOCT-like domain-containing protein n=1 Tax=Micromonospora echinospora TaxID=1877 RepID=UPI0036721833
MRAADTDREASAQRLRVALDEGRLDLHEYDERLRRAYAARTYAELDVLVADLPVGGSVALAGSPPAVPVPAGATRRWLLEMWEPWLTVVALVTAIWGVTALMAGETYYFWPGWVAGPWGAVRLVQTVSGLARGEPARWAAKQEKRRRKREARRHDSGDAA